MSTYVQRVSRDARRLLRAFRSQLRSSSGTQDNGDEAGRQLSSISTLPNLVTLSAIRAVVGLDIPDLIDSGTQHVEELARKTQSDPDALARILRHLVQRGVVRERAAGIFELTDVGELLTRSNPGSERARFLPNGVGPRFEAALAQMGYSLQAGLPAYPHIHGQGLWEQIVAEPAMADSFDAEMRANARVLDRNWRRPTTGPRSSQSLISVAGQARS